MNSMGKWNGQTVPVTNFTDRIYISGPMTGHVHHNYPAFNAVAKNLRDSGYVVYNPAENFGGDRKQARKEYMRVDIIHLLQAQTVVFLPKWEDSNGAELEMDIARELGLSIRFLHEGLYYE